MSKFLKYLLIGLGVFIGIIVLLNIIIPKPKMSNTSDIESKIKALDRINLELIKKQTVLDSVDAEYRARIEDIETRLMDIGQSKIIIQKVYSDKIQKSKTSSPSDLDTFFRDRYKY